MTKPESRNGNAAWLSEGAVPALVAVLLFTACAAFPRVSTAAVCAVMPNNIGTGTATVINAASGAPISGALVNWTYAGHTMRTATDSRGRMVFQVQVTNTTNGNPVALSVENNGYGSAAANATICPGTNTAVRVRLSAVAKFGTVKGQVTDPTTGLGIPDATITVLIGKFPQPGLTATTDTNGRYSIPHVGFAGGLTLQAALAEPSCVPPIRRTFAVSSATVTENFKFPVTTTITYCPPSESGDLSGAAARVSAATAPGAMADDSSAAPLALADSGITWQPATADSILVNAPLNTWNAGHINDILKTGPSQALIASDTGGVWSLAWSSSSAAALPLSTKWGSVAMSSLAQGPDGVNHVYAGTVTSDRSPGSAGGVLWETNTSAGSPLQSWKAHKPVGTCAQINHILVIPEFRRVVVACDNGVWWSPIPPAPAALGQYHWLRALPGSGVNPAPLQGGFARLVKGPGWTAAGGPPTEGTIAAVLWGGTAPGQLIYWGAWSGGQLLLNATTVDPGSGHTSMTFGRSTAAACPIDARMMYAAAEANDDLAAVWKSSNGGKTWTMVHLPPNGAPPNATGHMGHYNQAIAVSAANNCNTVAIGWQYSSFVSFNGGTTYPMALNGANSGCGPGGCNLHDDYHALLFDPSAPQILWFGTDGGLAAANGVVNGGSPTFTSYYNEHLRQLQIYHASPSYLTSNLVAGPLQDNAVAYDLLPGSWTRVPGSGGDGAYSEFLGVGSGAGAAGQGDTLIWNSPGNAWQQSPWNGGAFQSPSTVPVADSTNIRDPAGVAGGPNWNVRQPSYANAAGQLMYGVSGLGASVYGLFANTDGTDLHLESIGSIGSSDGVASVSSANGSTVFVGSELGNICQLTAPYTPASSCVNFVIQQPAGDTVARINGMLEFFSSIGLAATSSSKSSNGGYVLSLLGDSWQPTSGLPTNLPYNSVEGPNLGSVFVANTSQVFTTQDLGTTWLTASDGLPKVANGIELHYVAQPDGTHYIYLATYGWSMFRAPLP
jgi:hypothetical protein